MEICQGGELFDRITAKGSFSEKEARHAFSQIMSALNYCHLRKIAHRFLQLYFKFSYFSMLLDKI